MTSALDEKWIKDGAFLRAWETVRPYTMTSVERGYALWCSVEHILAQNIPGCFVECGVWKGGSTMLMILAMMRFGAVNREIFMFDTFTGMSAPTEQDVDLDGRTAASLMQGDHGATTAGLVQAAAPYAAVRKAIEITGIDMRLVRMVKGDVKNTLAQTQTMAISLLRLDTDFYDSTLAELEQLYPRVSQGGVLIIDDYGHWQGSQEAVETYFSKNKNFYSRPMLWAVDYTGRAGVKSEGLGDAEIARYDYLPDGIQAPDLLPYFPNAVAANPWAVSWPYLRKHVPHIWRTDCRHQGYVTGYASVEEATVLYSMATQFKGRRGLEIGSHYGWTAAHLLVAGLVLDCVDPAFQDADHAVNVATTFDALSPELSDPGKYRLWGGHSPQILDVVAASGDGSAYSFVFIDGDHDGDAPATDAQGVLPYLDDNAVVMLHDLTSPHVARALPVLAKAGFQIRLINTMQIMAVAWRGQVHVPSHVQDPNCGAIFIEHLTPYMEQG
jgi:predicted O-methyltransferase YrrM